MFLKPFFRDSARPVLSFMRANAGHGLAATLMLVLCFGAGPAAAQTLAPLQSWADGLLQTLTGKLGKSLVGLAIGGAGVAFMFQRINLMQLFYIGCGAMLLFGAIKIMEEFAATAGG